MLGGACDMDALFRDAERARCLESRDATVCEDGDDAGPHTCCGIGCPYVSLTDNYAYICELSGAVVDVVRAHDAGFTGRSMGPRTAEERACAPRKYRPQARRDYESERRASRETDALFRHMQDDLYGKPVWVKPGPGQGTALVTERVSQRGDGGRGTRRLRAVHTQNANDVVSNAADDRDGALLEKNTEEALVILRGVASRNTKRVLSEVGGVGAEANEACAEGSVRHARAVASLCAATAVLRKQCVSTGRPVTLDALHNVAISLTRNANRDAAALVDSKREIVRMYASIARLIALLWRACSQSPYLQTQKTAVDTYRNFVHGMLLMLRSGVRLPSGETLFPRSELLTASLARPCVIGGANRGVRTLHRSINSCADETVAASLFADAIRSARAFESDALLDDGAVYIAVGTHKKKHARR